MNLRKQLIQKAGKTMSIQDENSMAVPNLTGFPTFLFTVDGEIAYIEVLPPAAERKIACLSSSPQIHILEGGFPADGNLPKIGQMWT